MADLRQLASGSSPLLFLIDVLTHSKLCKGGREEKLEEGKRGREGMVRGESMGKEQRRDARREGGI